MTPLDNYPTIRAWVYTIFWIAGLVLGAAQIWYPAVHLPIPIWVNGGLAVYPYLGIGVGYTAFANMTENKS